MLHGFLFGLGLILAIVFASFAVRVLAALGYWWTDQSPEGWAWRIAVIGMVTLPIGAATGSWPLLVTAFVTMPVAFFAWANGFCNSSARFFATVAIIGVVGYIGGDALSQWDAERMARIRAGRENVEYSRSAVMPQRTSSPAQQGSPSESQILRVKPNPEFTIASQGMVGTGTLPKPTAATALPRPTPALPRYAAQELVGRWGMTAFHRPEDDARIEVRARSQCTQPYVIWASHGRGVKMYGRSDFQEMTTKGTVEGKTYVGPPGDPAGMDDREIVSFDGRVLVLKWVDPEVADRYGTMVLVRCEPTDNPPPWTEITHPQ
jgi:hypothetical protein